VPLSSKNSCVSMREMRDVSTIISGIRRSMAALSKSDMSGSHSLGVLWLVKTRTLGLSEGGGVGSRPKKMYGERVGDGVEYHLMKPTPHC